MVKVRSFFITGANRGLGLEMVKQVLEKVKPEYLFATYRDEKGSQELIKLSNEHQNLHLIQLDIKDDTKFPSIAAEVDRITKGTGVNVLVNNGGVYSDDGQTFETVTKETLMHYFEINTVGSFLMAKAFFQNLVKGAQVSEEPIGAGKALVVNISSGFASIGNNNVGLYYASRATRTSLNALTKNMSVEFIPKEVMAIALSPGWVQTDQGGPNAPLKPKESVEGMLNVILGLKEEDNGKFLEYDGKELPW